MSKSLLSESNPGQIAGMLAGFSIELNPCDPKAIETAERRLQPGTEVFLTWIGGEDPLMAVAPAARLRRVGLIPVPHLSARYVKSEQQLRDFVAKLSDAGVDRVLVVGGDSDEPVGPFDCSLAVLKSGILQEAGIRRIAVGGFPEGNPHIKHLDLVEVLAEKVSYGVGVGLQMSIVTQFGFEAEPVEEWLHRIHVSGIQVPVRIGLAGPAGILTLTRYALRCGVGNSLRVLTDNPSFAKLLVERGPEPLIRELADRLGAIDSLPVGVAGLHFFVFGGVNKTLDWIQACRQAVESSEAAKVAS